MDLPAKISSSIWGRPINYCDLMNIQGKFHEVPIDLFGTSLCCFLMDWNCPAFILVLWHFGQVVDARIRGLGAAGIWGFTIRLRDASWGGETCSTAYSWDGASITIINHNHISSIIHLYLLQLALHFPSTMVSSWMWNIGRWIPSLDSRWIHGLSVRTLRCYVDSVDSLSFSENGQYCK